MLIEFRVKNYRSFKTEQVLSMASLAKNADDSDLANNIAPVSDNDYVNLTTAIYGKNAAGKSNLLKAIKFVENLVRNSTDNKDESEIKVAPYKLAADTQNAPSEFEIYFAHKGIRYLYGFAATQRHILSEWLYAYPKGNEQLWFERSTTEDDPTKSTYNWGRNLKGQKQQIANLTIHNVLFLSKAANSGNEQLRVVREWFVKHLYIFDNEMPRRLLELRTAQLVEKNQGARTRLETLLRQSDTGVVGVEVELNEKNLNIDDLPMTLQQRVLNGEATDSFKSLDLDVSFTHINEDGAHVNMNLDEISLGTRRVFGLGGMMLNGLQDGDVVIVDELDDSLHPDMARLLIEMFHTPAINTNNAQLIFNTHDATLIDRTLFLRDQIWFVEKDQSNRSHLYSLLEFSPRKQENIFKGYLQGRYGAVPQISIDDLSEALNGEEK